MVTNDFTIRQAIWPDDRELLRQVREPVFIEEQGVPESMEWDDDDIIAYHLLALDNQQQPIGTARLLGNGQIGRMAVLASWRNRGIGTALLLELLQQASRVGQDQLFLHAQTTAETFYAKFGFIGEGDIFHEADIPHRKMFFSLTAQPSEDDLKLATLGKDDELFQLNRVEDHQIHAASMARQAKRYLCLFSYDLDSSVYDTESFHDAVKQLAMRSKFSRIRILIQDNSRIVQQGHRLIDLAQRLPSVIEIRKPSDEHLDIEENFLLADDCGYLYKQQASDVKGTARYNNRHFV
ncbi:MAG: GNAT family N-acetyltransferase, partial [Candidatus Thiodiazotropha sp. (ex Ctena orbiculata)]|nr:GNAT family N-acetyltransferase [Candidatus Thiodiazotropha taylori]